MTDPVLVRARIRHALPLVSALCVAAALSGCAVVVGGAVVGGAMVAVDRRTTGTQVDDEAIELKANGRMNEAFGDRARVSTTSYNRMVLLTGEVPTDADKTTAEQAVARIDNVQSVRAMLWQVRSSPGALKVRSPGAPDQALSARPSTSRALQVPHVPVAHSYGSEIPARSPA